MKLNRPAKIIRTDKWFLQPSDEQRLLFATTVKEYRKLCRFLVTVINTHWVELGALSSQAVTPAQVVTNRMASPSLILNSKSCYLSVPFACKPDKRTGSGCIVRVDLGINTTATVSVVSNDGTVMHREFIHPGRAIDRRDNRLKSINRKASKTIAARGIIQLTDRKDREDVGGQSPPSSPRNRAVLLTCGVEIRSS